VPRDPGRASDRGRAATPAVPRIAAVPRPRPCLGSRPCRATPAVPRDPAPRRAPRTPPIVCARRTRKGRSQGDPAPPPASGASGARNREPGPVSCVGRKESGPKAGSFLSSCVRRTKAVPRPPASAATPGRTATPGRRDAPASSSNRRGPWAMPDRHQRTVQRVDRCQAGIAGPSSGHSTVAPCRRSIGRAWRGPTRLTPGTNPRHALISDGRSAAADPSHSLRASPGGDPAPDRHRQA
jgi:hypothetical protein